jgi:uncharacterized protein
MKLFVDRIEGTPKHVRFEASADWWSDRVANEAAAFDMVGPPVFELDVHSMGRDLLVSGHFEAEVEATCSRCLERYRQPLRDDYRLVLEPAEGVEMPDPESVEALARDGVCLGEELEVGWYQGKELHLDRFFDEVITLALPLVPLCREDCPGLCPVCGANRSTETCDCNPTLPESPFAALAALRSTGGDGEDGEN